MKVLLLALVLFVFAPTVAAQSTGVYVTTQDSASLRASSNGEATRLTVIPPGVTLEALERSVGTRWIKVTYDGQTGWVASWLLIWTGDVFALPEEPQPVVESASGVRVTTQDFTALRAGPGRAWERIAMIPPSVALPAIGRSPSAFWIQVEYQGQNGWIAFWLLSEQGNVFTLPLDGVNPLPFVRTITSDSNRARLNGSLRQSRAWILAHRYSFLIAPLFNDLVSSQEKLAQIRQIWLTIQRGESAACGSVPEFASYRSFSEINYGVDVIFKPVTIAVESAVAHTNRAISLFSDACSQQTFVEPSQITEAFDEIAGAQRSYNLAESLLDTLESR